MYNIILVDDEPWALMGAGKIYPWLQYGFRVCGSFGDPLEALAFIKENPVDFVLSDIRMPNLTGIEFMVRAQELNPDITFAFVSGHADFTYVQQALRKGAYDYLLKPVGPKDAEAFVIRLSDYLHSLTLTKNLRDFQEMQNSPMTISDLFPDHSHCSCSLQGILIEQPNTGDLIFSLPEEIPHRKLNLGLGKHFVLAATPEDLLPHISRYQDMEWEECSAGISRFDFSIRDTQKVIAQANQALLSMKYRKENGISAYTIFTAQQLKSLMDRAVVACQTKDYTSLRCILDEAVEQGIQLDEAILIWNQLMFSCDSFSNPQKECPPEWKCLSMQTLREQFRSFDDMWDSLIDILQNQGSASPEHWTYNQLYEKMLSFISAHYTEDIYLKDIADLLYINFSYACELFKKHSGTTFSKYLTSLRMNKATELLLSTNLTIEDICYQVGYNNYSYFNRVFKKEFNITPFQYRANHK